MNTKLLTEHNFEPLRLKGGCRGSSESTLDKMPRWKSHVTAHMLYFLTLQWQFLARDEGESNPESDPGWLQDEGKLTRH